MVKFENSWDDVLAGEFEKDYYLKLREFLKQEYSTQTVYPEMGNIFNALKLTPYDQVRAVILGQDPYHEPGQAQGLCFSVPRGVEIPPSLRNIYRELRDDLGIAAPEHGCLEHWARNGVLLLNTVLTVRAHQAHSHKNQGWEIFTDQVIRILNERPEPMMFILWGRPAQMKEALITGPQHEIIMGAHPSPLSAHKGFWGGRYFSRTNDFLTRAGQEPIDWSIPE